MENHKLDLSRTRRRPNVLLEFGAFVLEHKKWWLVPLTLVLLLLGTLVLLGGSAAAPFIYTLF